jgi:hypothetical protein
LSHYNWCRAPSYKQQATSSKPQAASNKAQAEKQMIKMIFFLLLLTSCALKPQIFHRDYDISCDSKGNLYYKNNQVTKNWTSYFIIEEEIIHEYYCEQ